MTTDLNEHIGRTGARRRGAALWLAVLVTGASAAVELASVASAQAPSAACGADQAAEEKAACIKNLKVIYQAIQAY